MKIVIAGGSGFLGSPLAEMYAEQALFQRQADIEFKWASRLGAKTGFNDIAN